jgi:PAS domain S-box-containing protein
MMTFKRHLVAALLLLILGCLAGVGWLIYGNQRAEMESERGERHTREVIQQLSDLLSSLKGAETGQRGFIITGNPDYLEPYQASLAAIEIGLADLRRLTADDPGQQQRLDAITPLVAAKLADLKETIALRESQGMQAASEAVTTQSGKKIMDQIRARLVQAEAHEAQLLKERVAIHATDNRRTMQSVTLGSVLAGLALLLLFIRLRCELANRRRAQELVARQAAELTTLYATAPVGLFFYDTDLRYVRVNPAMAELNGLPAELHIGRTLRELLTPALADDVEAQVRQVLDTGRPLLNCEVHGATNPRASETQRHWVVSYHPVQAEDGTIRGVQGAVLDITERKKAEEALQQSEARFRALLNSGAVAIYSCDCAGKILEINRAAIDLWGCEPKPGETDAQFRGAFKSLRPDGSRLPYAETWMTRVLNGEIVAARNEEVGNERSDGSRITVIVNVLPLKNEQGEITGAMLCFYDITERKQLEQESLEQAQTLAELDRRKDEFLAMLSHELRNPLAALSSAVLLLHLSKSEEPLLLQGRGIIERQLGHLKHLVDDLLEVSRISTGRVKLRSEQIAISFVVEQALETAQPLMAQRRHTVTVSVPAEPLWLHADTARLEQVVVNLLTNAAKYTDSGGRIWLSVVREGDAAVLRVRDSGIGIAPELLPHIFDLFTQAERSLDRSQGGLGIGLCLVQQLVELHGGSVTAHSVLGQGSEFVVRLPLMLTALPASPTFPALASDSAFAPEKASSSCRVLVVDDNVDAAQALARVLEMTGHEVRLAYDGPTGLQAALDYQPEVVLLDIGLPGLSGHEVAQRIRQQAALKNIVLVALTGYGHDTDRQRVQEAGFDHHLVKPASFSQIEDILLGVSERVT